MGIGWRAGTTLGVAAGALTTWLAAPWVAMTVHGTVDGRRSAWLRTQQRHGGTAGPRLRLVHPDSPVDPGRAGMPHAWDSIPGPRPRTRGRSRASS